MADVVLAHVAKSMIKARLAEGWEPVKGDSPDGLRWEGDALVMQMDRQKYERLQKERRAAYEQLQRYIEAGGMPVQTEHGVQIRFTREDNTGEMVRRRKKE